MKFNRNVDLDVVTLFFLLNTIGHEILSVHEKEIVDKFRLVLFCNFEKGCIYSLIVGILVFMSRMNVKIS